MRWHSIFSLASLPFILAASPNRPPVVDVNRTCHAEGVEKSAAETCIRSENAAKDQLSKTWSQIPAPTRENCSAEIRIGGSPSYVDLITCVEMDQWSRER